MAYHNILSKCDRALMQYIINNNAGTSADVFPGKRSQDKTLPCTICWSHSCTTDREIPYSGNYQVEAFVEVRTSGIQEEFDQPNDPANKAIGRIEQTFDLFFKDDPESGRIVADALTAAAKTSPDPDMQDFHAYDVRAASITQGFNPRNPKLAGNAWEDCLHLEIFCCPANVL